MLDWKSKFWAQDPVYYFHQAYENVWLLAHTTLHEKNNLSQSCLTVCLLSHPVQYSAATGAYNVWGFSQRWSFMDEQVCVIQICTHQCLVFAKVVLVIHTLLFIYWRTCLCQSLFSHHQRSVRQKRPADGPTSAHIWRISDCVYPHLWNQTCAFVQDRHT